MKKYTVFAALREDSHQGWVWLMKPGLPPRGVVKISNLENGKSIYCETLQLESNFVGIYNNSNRYRIKDQDSTIILNAWYRAGLGIDSTQCEIPLLIESFNCSWLAKLKTCIGHPQLVVRVATVLGGVSVVLGLFGFAISIYGCIS